MKKMLVCKSKSISATSYDIRMVVKSIAFGRFTIATKYFFLVERGKRGFFDGILS